MTWLTVMECLCYTWPRIWSTRKHFPVLSSFMITGVVTRLTRRVPPVEQELLTLPEHLSPPPVFSGVRVTRSLVLCVCLEDCCLSFCIFSLGHYVVCSSSIYGFWLPLWYLQAHPASVSLSPEPQISFVPPCKITLGDPDGHYFIFNVFILVFTFILDADMQCGFGNQQNRGQIQIKMLIVNMNERFYNTELRTVWRYQRGNQRGVVVDVIVG